ncbi:MAG: hypothetical protein IJV26_01205 [Lachnospiraceae bacterium]|nr:hypothetical protein [Lachnospiraceae bacterium]
MKRIKRTSCLILALLVTFCLAGCESTQDPQEAEGLNEAARGILQEWLNEAEPGAEILSCKADTFQYPGQVKAYLTGYVSGSFQSGEETTGYTVCPATGRIYLDADMEVLGEAMYDYILSCMELEEIEERTDYSVDLELPYCYEGPGSRGSLKGKMFSYGRLPAELALQMQDMPEAAEPAALEDFRQAVQDWLSDPETGTVLACSLTEAWRMRSILTGTTCLSYRSGRKRTAFISTSSPSGTRMKPFPAPPGWWKATGTAGWRRTA